MTTLLLMGCILFLVWRNIKLARRVSMVEKILFEFLKDRYRTADDD